MEADYPGTMRIAPNTAEVLRRLAAQAERLGHLTEEQLALVYANRWFKLFVPHRLGGLELSVPEGVRLEEELARIDGSLGWTVTLCAGANLFVGFMDSSVSSTMFATPSVCLGGSGQASGTAMVDNGGYRITGRWRYATGAPHLTHFTANCVIEQDGQPVPGEDGQPLVKSFFVPREHVQVIDDWNAFGLKATASHSFKVTDVWVPETNAFVIGSQHAKLPQTIYRYPFQQFAEATLAVNTLGIARHFIECLEAHAGERLVNLTIDANAYINTARDSFYQVLDASWQELMQRGDISPEARSAVSAQSRHLAEVARQQVVLLYPYAGMAAADPSTAMNRCWRDLFTASQHSIFRS